MSNKAMKKAAESFFGKAFFDKRKSPDGFGDSLNPKSLKLAKPAVASNHSLSHGGGSSLLSGVQWPELHKRALPHPSIGTLRLTRFTHPTLISQPYSMGFRCA